MNHANRDLKLSDSGLDLIKRFESFRPDWYLCPAGKKTIGYGHVRKPGDDFSLPVSEQFASALLRQDVAIAEINVRQLVKVALEQHQFDALVSLVFNIGGGAFSRSTLLKKLNAGDIDGAANEFTRWCIADGEVLPGLQRRRQDERALFLGEV